MDQVYIIYKHTCTTTGKSYIGQTKDYATRTKEHQQPRSRCPAFRNAVQKHGWNMFTSVVLMEGLSQEAANQHEEELIAAHGTLAPRGYNLVPGGRNHSHTAETRLKLSQRVKHPVSEETRAKLRKAREGYRHSVETKQKMTKTRTGRTHSDEAKANMRKPHGRYTVNIPIIQLTTDGVEVARFDSPRDAKLATGNKNLANALAGYCKTSGGFIWRYA